MRRRIMVRFPYRWLPRTVIQNLSSALYDIRMGIVNIIRWIPVIWFDRDDDWTYLAKVMEYKLDKMSNLFRDYGHLQNSDKYARETRICSELLKRLRTESYTTFERGEEYTRSTAKRDTDIANLYQRHVGKLIGKHLTWWWD
jgi:hypothetical protein